MLLSDRLTSAHLGWTLPPVTIPFGKWSPDLADLNPGIETEVKNVIPLSDGYAPFPDCSAQSDALTARCQGASSGKDTTGNIYVFAGDATNLYRLANQSFTDVSSATYTTAADATWEFVQFGSRIIATNYNDPVQSFTIAGSGNFADMITSTNKPKAKHVDVIRDFVVLGNTTDTTDGTQPTRVWWSGINDPTDYDPSQTTQCDFQNIPFGGHVQQIVGGVEYGLVFLEKQIYRQTYVGTPFIFQFDAIDRRRGATIPNGIVAFGRFAFFPTDEGFFVTNGVESEPIGHGQVDRTFLNEFDIANAHRCSSAMDPKNKLYMLLYPGTGSEGGAPNKLLLYNWIDKKWARIEVNDLTGGLEFLFWGASPGFTLEDLDSVSGSIDALTESLDSIAWQGSEKLASFDTNHKLCLFTGDNLEATIESADYTAGSRSLVRNIRPLIDADEATIAVASRARLSDTATFGTATSMTTNGDCPVLSEGRYHKFRLSVPAGVTWTRAQGADVEASRAGVR